MAAVVAEDEWAWAVAACPVLELVGRADALAAGWDVVARALVAGVVTLA